jgi:diacylglycerol kinase family enzyme
MKLAQLLHNPGAGEEGHSRKELIGLIEKTLDVECRYFSTKENDWQDIEPGIDLLIIAGGDGTVRKVSRELLNRKRIDRQVPIAILPLGTANNIAKTLELTGDVKDIIKQWRKKLIRKFDIGRIEGIPGQQFFLEGFGYGIFPKLVKDMRKHDKQLKNMPEEKMKKAVETLREVIRSRKPFSCSVEIDGVDHSGNYILVEVMNIESIGPNLQLAPHANPGDGKLDVVLLTEQHRDQLLAQIENGDPGNTMAFPVFSGSSIHLHCESSRIHIDDELIKIVQPGPVHIEAQSGMLDFLIAGD